MINDWSDVFLRRTNCYLRIVTTVDLSFSKGEFPEESDFPAILNSSKLSAILPLYGMDPGTFKNKDSTRSGNPPTNGEIQMKPDTNHANFNSKTGYNPTSSTGVPPTTQGNMGEPQFDAGLRVGFDHAFPSHMEFTDPNRDFNLDSWIYDVLPTFT